MLLKTEDYKQCFGKSGQQIYNDWVTYLTNETYPSI